MVPYHSFIMRVALSDDETTLITQGRDYTRAFLRHIFNIMVVMLLLKVIVASNLSSIGSVNSTSAFISITYLGKEVGSSQSVKWKYDRKNWRLRLVPT